MPNADAKYPGPLFDASTVDYTPAVPGDWSVAPTDAAGALDELADRIDDAEALYPPDAAVVTYTPGTSSHWPSGDPGDADNAFDKLAQYIASLHTPLSSGDWTSGCGFGEVNFTGTFTTPAADTIIGVPFFSPWRMTYASIGMSVTVGPLNARAKMGIYAMGTNGKPGSRLYDGSASPVDIDTVTAGGTVLGELGSISQTLDRGWYVLAALVNAGVVGAITVSAEARAGSKFGSRATALGDQHGTFWYVSSTYASGLPSSFGTPTSGTSNSCPRIMLEVS